MRQRATSFSVSYYCLDDDGFASRKYSLFSWLSLEVNTYTPRADRNFKGWWNLYGNSIAKVAVHTT